MLRFTETNIFNSPAQTLVNTVNTTGVMGKGIAKEFKTRYPAMFREYKKYCDSRELSIGTLHVWRESDRWVLNFPTKTTWRRPSELKYIEAGLRTFRDNYNRLGITSISFPPLGCGNGNLNWAEVKPLMVRYLSCLDAQIWIHERHVPQHYKTEHEEVGARQPPATFEDFKSDLRSATQERGGSFFHFTGQWPYQAVFDEQDDRLQIFLDKQYFLDEDFVELAWICLRLGVLTLEHFGAHANQRVAGYLMPIIHQLPYVKKLTISKNNEPGASVAGLYFGEANYDQGETIRTRSAA